jgi:DNA-binding MurR/RpiR family transcriptional regulator
MLSGAAKFEKLLVQAYDTLSPQLQVAGRYLLDHPHEIALRSMRELAREANLSPATMTRLASQLGFSGFDDLKKLYVSEIRQYAAGYRTKAIKLADIARREDANALTAGVVAGIARQVEALQRPETILSLVECARVLAGARTIYCLGQRLSFPPAYTFQYIHSVAGGSSVLLDGPGGIGFDALRHATSIDAVLAITVLPYTKVTIEQAAFAKQRGIQVVAITDSEVSPLARIATHAVKVSTKSESFFQTMGAVSAVAEILATMIAMRSQKQVLDGLKESEDYFAAASIYWSPSSHRGTLLNGDFAGRKRSKE